MSKSKPPIWGNAERFTGSLVLLALAGGVAYGLYYLLPVLNAVLGSILSLSLLLILVGIIGYVIFDRQTRQLVTYGYRSVIRSITNAFIKRNPIAIMKGHIKHLKTKVRNMSVQIGKLRTQIRQIESLIRQNERVIDREMERASTAKAGNNEKALVLATRKASRLKESNERYSKLLARMENLYGLLTRVYKTTEIVLEDTVFQVRLKEEEYKAIKASHSAMASAREVMGAGKSMETFEKTMEFMADDIATKIGEIDRLMDVSSNFMAEVDLKNAQYADDGLEMLESLEKQSQVMQIEKSGDYSHLLHELEKEAIERPPTNSENRSNKP